MERSAAKPAAIRAAVCCAIAASLSACSGATGLQPLPDPNLSAPRAAALPVPGSRTLSPSPEHAGPDAKQQLLYVSNVSGNAVEVFDAATKTKNPPPLRTITSGISFPRGITTDQKGNLYVANSGNNTVTVYAPNASSPSFTLTDGLDFPVDVKVDGSGNIYVANSPSSGPSIALFPQGSTSPSYDWVPAGVQYLTGIALLNPTTPNQTSIYALAENSVGSTIEGAVISCYPGNVSCTQVSGYAFGYTGGIAVEQSPTSQSPLEYLVVDQGYPGVDTFVNQQLTGQLFTGGVPTYAALNRGRTGLFVVDSRTSRVEKYSFPDNKQLNSYALNNEAYGVAVYPAGTYF